MSFDTLQLGPVPCEENCAQVGHADYPEQSSRECRVYLRMLARLHPVPMDCEGSARLTVKSFAHDYGSYREVCVVFDTDHRSACEHAYSLEADGPSEWDDIARYELLWLARYAQYQRAVQRGDLPAHELPDAFRTGQPPELPPGKTMRELLDAWPL